MTKEKRQQKLFKEPTKTLQKKKKQKIKQFKQPF